MADLIGFETGVTPYRIAESQWFYI
jgi:hypothetical protein